MIICHCRSLTDRDVARAVARGAKTFAQVFVASGTAVDCGGCRAGVEEVVAAAGSALRQRAPAKSCAACEAESPARAA